MSETTAQGTTAQGTVDYKVLGIDSKSVQRGYMLDRQKGAPLTTSEIFLSCSDIDKYLKNSELKYAGQIVVVADVVYNNDVKATAAPTNKGVYVITYNNKWGYEKVGSGSGGDTTDLGKKLTTLDKNVANYMNAQTCFFTTICEP